MNGYIFLHRKLIEDPIWTQMPPAWLKVFMGILLKANHKPVKWWDRQHKCEIEIPAGAFITSTEKLSEFCHVTFRQVRGTLEYLKAANTVTCRASSHYTLITVSNWDTYQRFFDDDGKADGKADGIQTASNGATSRHPEGKLASTAEELKNLKPEEPTFFLDASDQNTPQKVSEETVINRWFDSEFWPLYPKKTTKKESLAVAMKVAKSAAERAAIIAGLKAQLPGMMGERRFIKDPVRWLRGERWKDEVVVAPNGSFGKPDLFAQMHAHLERKRQILENSK